MQVFLQKLAEAILKVDLLEKRISDLEKRNKELEETILKTQHLAIQIAKKSNELGTDVVEVLNTIKKIANKDGGKLIIPSWIKRYHRME